MHTGYLSSHRAAVYGVRAHAAHGRREPAVSGGGSQSARTAATPTRPVLKLILPCCFPCDVTTIAVSSSSSLFFSLESYSQTSPTLGLSAFAPSHTVLSSTVAPLMAHVTAACRPCRRPAADHATALAVAQTLHLRSTRPHVPSAPSPPSPPRRVALATSLPAASLTLPTHARMTHARHA
jgi:hypothetical protein